MKNPRAALSLRVVFVVVAVVCLLLVFRSWRASAQDRMDNSLNVPILVSPSIQPGQGQSVLFKATNISGTPVGVKFTLFSDADGAEVESTDFAAIPPRVTVTHLYTPPPGKLVLGGTTFDAPAAVRALVGPLSGGEPAAIRRVVAGLQMVSLKPAAATAALPPLDPPTVVPLERCLFKPRGMFPYTGARYIWDCSPTM
jgi:hypothetical protein